MTRKPICTNVCRYTSAHACGGQRSKPGVFLRHFRPSPVFLDTESFGELHLESLASKPWGSSCLHLPHTGAAGACCHARLLDTASGGLGLASHVCTASIVLIPSHWVLGGKWVLGVLCQAWPFAHLLPGCHGLSAVLFHQLQLPLEPASPWQTMELTDRGVKALKP